MVDFVAQRKWPLTRPAPAYENAAAGHPLPRERAMNANVTARLLTLDFRLLTLDSRLFGGLHGSVGITY